MRAGDGRGGGVLYFSTGCMSSQRHDWPAGQTLTQIRQGFLNEKRQVNVTFKDVGVKEPKTSFMCAILGTFSFNVAPLEKRKMR